MTSTPNRSPGDGSMETLIREMSARFSTQLEGLEQRISETREDAREARDGVKVLTERFGAHDMPTKLAELRADMNSGFKDARADLVNSFDKLTRESREGHDALKQAHAALSDRVKSLEDFRNRIEGATGFVGWIGRNWTALTAIVFAVAAALGWRDKF